MRRKSACAIPSWGRQRPSNIRCGRPLTAYLLLRHSSHHAHHTTIGLPAWRIQCLHDVRLVCASEEFERQALVHRGLPELGGIAFLEYMLQVPANRIGYTVMTLPQLKIL